MERLKVGLAGCGMISEIYLKNMRQKFDKILEPYACADIIPEAANKRAEQFGMKAARSVDELITDPQVDIVLNLTTPAAHTEISRKALLAGKHAYSEKPFATNLKDGEELLALAKKNGLLVAAAPDTFLGGGLQTCRRLLEDGSIGTPISATGTMLAWGPERFHPHPEFLYEEGAGPLLDMGPYYITAMVSLLGPATRVSGMAKSTFPERTKIQTGEKFASNVETFISGMLEFENGVIANVTTSWDMQFPYWQSKLPLLEIFGSSGTMILPDPNTFCGISDDPMVKIGDYVQVRKGSGEFEEVPVEFGYFENSRGLGLADFAWAIRNGGEPRVNGEMSLHVLEIMLGILESARNGAAYSIKNTCKKPEPLYGVVPFK